MHDMCSCCCWRWQGDGGLRLTCHKQRLLRSSSSRSLLGFRDTFIVQVLRVLRSNLLFRLFDLRGSLTAEVRLLNSDGLLVLSLQNSGARLALRRDSLAAPPNHRHCFFRLTRPLSQRQCLVRQLYWWQLRLAEVVVVVVVLVLEHFGVVLFVGVGELGQLLKLVGALRHSPVQARVESGFVQLLRKAGLPEKSVS